MTLDFGTAQIAALAVFGAIAVFFVITFTIIAVASRSSIATERVQSVGYAIRKPWFLFLVTLMVLTLAGLSFFLPYASGGEPAANVRVIGGQFFWSMSQEEFRAGDVVLFEVSSADVNHGFGLYDPDGQLIGSVQAMPGYVNDLRVTLDKAGSYTVACLEFCGVDHHVMIREFEVVG